MSFSWANTVVELDGEEAANLVILLAQQIEKLKDILEDGNNEH